MRRQLCLRCCRRGCWRRLTELSKGEPITEIIVSEEASSDQAQAMAGIDGAEVLLDETVVSEVSERVMALSPSLVMRQRTGEGLLQHRRVASMALCSRCCRQGC